MRWRSCCGRRELTCGSRWRWPDCSLALMKGCRALLDRTAPSAPLRAGEGGCPYMNPLEGIKNPPCWADLQKVRGRAEAISIRRKQGVLTENLWPKLFSEAPRCAPLRLYSVK